MKTFACLLAALVAAAESSGDVALVMPDENAVLRAMAAQAVKTEKGRRQLHGDLKRRVVYKDSGQNLVREEYADGTFYVFPMEVKTNAVRRATGEGRKKAAEKAAAAKRSRMSQRQREAMERMEKLRSKVITIEKNANTGEVTVK